LWREWPIEQRPGLQNEIECIGIGGTLALAACALDLKHVDAQPAKHPRNHALLAVREVFDILIEPVRPEMQPGFGRDQLGVYPQHAAELAHAALQHVTHTEFGDDFGLDALAPLAFGCQRGEAVLREAADHVDDQGVAGGRDAGGLLRCGGAVYRRCYGPPANRVLLNRTSISGC
jgi:hypothetical protein